MQISNSVGSGIIPPSQGGGSPDIATQLREQQQRHQRILRSRALRVWIPRILIILFAGLIASVIGQFFPLFWKYFLVGAVGIVLVVAVLKNGTFALFIATAICTAWAPPAGTVKSLDLYPVYLLVPLLFFQIMILASFHKHKYIWPSFFALWPQFGLICMVVISNIMIRFTWTVGVPKELNHNPLYYSEGFGLIVYLIPLFTILLICALLKGREQWVEILQRIYILLAVAISLLVIIEFRRLGSNASLFRYQEPQIWWMKLRAIVQLISLGAILAYVRLWCEKRWLERILYAGSVVICVFAVYVSLENSWWIEVALALGVITLLAGKPAKFWDLVLRVVQRIIIISAVLVIISPILIRKAIELASIKSVDFYRLIIWQDGLRVWSKQPVLGVGSGNYWSFDQRFTHLPRFLSDFAKDGLGVAHNGYIQTLGEMGPAGEFFLLSFIVLMLVLACRLTFRSDKDNPKTRNDYILGLGTIALIVGSMFADFVSGEFFWPPRQIGSSHSLNQIMTTWVIFAFLLYKDRLRRLREAQLAGQNTGIQIEEVERRGLTTVTPGMALEVEPKAKMGLIERLFLA